MTDDAYTSKMVFHNVKATNMYVAGRDMFVGGWNDGSERFRAVRNALESSTLPNKDDALKQLDATEEEARKELYESESDLKGLGNRVEGLTRVLKDSGSLITAGTALGQALQQLAGWLGPAGNSILRLVS